MTVEQIRPGRGPARRDRERRPRARRRDGHGASMTARRHRAFYMFTAPWIIGFLLLTVFPMAYALWLSFTNFDGISPALALRRLRQLPRAASRIR